MNLCAGARRHDARQRVRPAASRTSRLPGAPRRRCGPGCGARGLRRHRVHRRTPLGGGHPRGTPPGLVVEVRSLLARGAPFVYATTTASTGGPCEGAGRALRADSQRVDSWSRFAAPLPPGAALVAPPTTARSTSDPPPRCSRPSDDASPCLVGRGASLAHTAPEATDDVAEAAREKFADVALGAHPRTLIDEHWLGASRCPTSPTASVTVALVPFEPPRSSTPPTRRTRWRPPRLVTPPRCSVPLLTFAVSEDARRVSQRPFRVASSDGDHAERRRICPLPPQRPAGVTWSALPGQGRRRSFGEEGDTSTVRRSKSPPR